MREEVYRSGVVQCVGFVGVLDDDGCVVRLSLQAYDLCVPALAEDDYLRLRTIVLMLVVAGCYAFLQTLHDGACAVDYLVAVLLCYPVG